MKEIWKTIPGYEGFLEASSEGRVRSLPSIRESTRDGVTNIQRKRGGVYSPFTGTHGYLQIAPKFGQNRRKLLVHRLVASAFVTGYFNAATVNHIDGDKTNNRVSNLEWTSLSDNTRLQWKTGLVDLRGEKHPSAKLRDDDVKRIQTRISSGDRIIEIARDFGVSDALIYKIRSGKKRAHS